MFKFNFKQSDSDEINDFFTEKDSNSETSQSTTGKEAARLLEECEEITPKPDQLIQKFDDDKVQIIMFSGGQVIVCIPGDKDVTSFVSSNAGEVDVSSEKFSHSDLIPGIYEGGGKVWECTQDLGNYLTEPEENLNAIVDEFKDKKILDLGCGAGILGILALKSNAKMVTFQDYNKNVLTNVTISNIVLNLSDDDEDDNDRDLSDDDDSDNFNLEELIKRCHFYSGDWTNYIEKTKTNDDEQLFDVILTSETIYNPQNYGKILNVFKSKLAPSGCVYLAAKIYYFGVGGSIREFEKFIQNDGKFDVKVVWKSEENVSREILKITHRKC